MAGEDRQLDDTYTVAEIAAMWKISKDSVRRLFAHEAGVLAFQPSRAGNTKRAAKTTLRIPKEVLERVKNRHTLLVA